MYLLVGLGNPGNQYKLTHHNTGFIIVDAICKYWNFNVFLKKKGYLISYGTIKEKKILLLKPYSFINNSGIYVQKIISLYKLSINNTIIIHDDADLKLGKIKIKKGGSSGGHNGVKSIDNFIGKNYWRLRFGIGRSNNKTNLSNYVLSEFKNFNKINLLIEKIAENIYLMFQKNNRILLNTLSYNEK